MAQILSDNNAEVGSNENSASTKEFLHIEKTCETYKDSDEEMKFIFDEINKLSGANSHRGTVDDDFDDVELILKRAEDIAQETQNILKTTPVYTKANNVVPNKSLSPANAVNVPVIRVTKPKDVESNGFNKMLTDNSKTNQRLKQNGKEVPNEFVRKQRTRPFSASVIDCKKKEASRLVTNSQKKSLSCINEALTEELKDTNERVKSLELLNVKLNDDIKILRKKLDQVNEIKHTSDLKLSESEHFINRLGKEYENRNFELKSAKENENRLIAELNRERNERKNISIQHDKDKIVIQDLQRQCKEMEMILKRKHPDSVSALIVAAKSSSVEDNKKKLLEERIARLERELKDKEDHFQGILLTLQEKFGDMKQKYESHIIDVERQLMDDRKTNTELKNKVKKSNVVDSSVQTLPTSQHSVSSQTFIKPSERASSAVSRLSQNSTILLNKLKEDSYLVATIKGLQSELTVKQRTIAKINRETEELKKNLRCLQKDKEVLMNLNPQRRSVNRQAKSAENIIAKVNTEMEAELVEIKKQKDVLFQERNTLLNSLKRTNEDFIMLKKKRIQDLHTLQLAHEKELMQMNMQVYPLQEEIRVLTRTVEVLQERTRYQAGSRQREVGDGDTLRGQARKDMA